MEENEFEEQISFKKELFRYLSHWKLFVISVLLALTAAFLYIQQANVVYRTESKIKILEDDKGLQLPTDAFSLLSNSKVNLENEIEVLRSKVIFEKVITDLNLTTNYFAEGNFRRSELWDVPFKVTLLTNNKPLSKTLQFNVARTENGYVVEYDDKKTTYAGSSVNAKIANREIAIEANPDYTKPLKGERVYVELESLANAQEKLAKRVTVEAVGKESEVLSVSYEGANIEKSKAVVNKLVEKFSEDGVIDRQIVSKKTVEFIDDRFQFLSEELDSIETRKKDYKQSNSLSFTEADVTVDVGQKAQSEQGVFQIETQIALSNLLKKTLQADNSIAVLPANIGLDNQIINNLIADYNSSVLTYDKLSVSAGLSNPAMMTLKSQITALKASINQSINTYLKQLTITLSQQKSNYSRTMNQVSNIPVNEQILRGIDRQQKIKEDLYLLLLQKREESAIAYAVTVPSIKIIDYANTGQFPIAPKGKLLYAGAFLIGLILPLILLYLKFTFDTKIKDARDIVFIKSSIPVISELPFFKNFALFENKDDRSVPAESFRILSSNIDFSLPMKMAGQGQVILVTSSIMGEGKTYIAANLALTYASYNKKVLLIGGDMRKPKLSMTLHMEQKEKGLSSYLHEGDASWKSLLTTDNPYNDYLDILFSGFVPPNPSTLFSGDRFSQLIAEARREYDYIILDSAPTIHVNDTFLIARTADLTLYVTRYGYTDKDLVAYSKNLSQNGKLPNMVYILNGIINKTGFNNRYSYNYGYSYGYDIDRK